MGSNETSYFWLMKSDRLAELWNQGKTARQIAEDIGCSRNMVIGRAHRMGLKPRPSPIKRKPLVDAYDGKQCEWPIGDPQKPGFRFCKSKRVNGRPYCSAHCKKAYRRPSEVAAAE